jgi:GTPase SAR1 family protein
VHLVLVCDSFFASFTRRDKANSVGKTSLTRQYIQPPTYVEGYFPTIEQTERKHIMYDGIDYDCEIIDTAGQVRLSPPSLP